jgi:hypothetical protein
MKQELQENLFRKFPHLYTDRTKPMTQTCMCWGIDCGDGWYKLIYDLSENLEKLIVQYIKEHPKTLCNVCNCAKEEHYGCLSYSPGKCLSIKKTPRYQIKYWVSPGKNLFQKAYRKVFKFFVRAANIVLGVFFYKLHSCWCEKYDAIYPRASQVKEKFGTLRFYMTSHSEEMHELIDQAEAISGKTCENCGGPGRLNNSGWISCLCDECRKKRR